MWIDADVLDALLHDLGGPVGRVGMLADLLARRDALDEDGRTLLTHISVSAASGEAVLHALRRYVEVARLAFQSAPFQLSMAVETAVHRLENQLTSSGGRVTYGCLPEIRGDRAQLAILFQELIANSLQFRSEQAPAVDVRVECPDAGYWSICISDNGVGLKAPNPERIFRAFARNSGGSRVGVGLAICRHIARLHGGEMAANPRPDGAEFQLRLPR